MGGAKKEYQNSADSHDNSRKREKGKGKKTGRKRHQREQCTKVERSPKSEGIIPGGVNPGQYVGHNQEKQNTP